MGVDSRAYSLNLERNSLNTPRHYVRNECATQRQSMRSRRSR
jgi:hypothetical protein